MNILNFYFNDNLLEDAITTKLWDYLVSKDYKVTRSFINNLANVGFFDRLFEVVNNNYDLSYNYILDDIDIEYCLRELEYNNDWTNRFMLSEVKNIFSKLKIDYDLLIENVDGNMISDNYNAYELVDYLERNKFSTRKINYIKKAFEEFYEALTENIVEYGNPNTLPQYYSSDVFTVNVVPFGSNELVQVAFDTRSMNNLYEYSKNQK